MTALRPRLPVVPSIGSGGSASTAKSVGISVSVSTR